MPCFLFRSSEEDTLFDTVIGNIEDIIMGKFCRCCCLCFTLLHFFRPGIMGKCGAPCVQTAIKIKLFVDVFIFVYFFLIILQMMTSRIFSDPSWRSTTWSLMTQRRINLFIRQFLMNM